LILGLLLFLGVHSVRIVADDWRSEQIARFGENRWKLTYSLASLVGLMVLIWGYGMTRSDPVFLWHPPLWTRHLVGLLMIPAFILLAAAYVPNNRIKATLGHPMILGVKVWALGHLLANGRLGDVVLFGAFLVWAVLDFRAARRRPAGPAVSGALPGDIATVAVGLLAWAAFAFYLHAWLIGVPLFA
ncbi:MAG: NnrU family protein, partial [Candidatus Competibacterales bacterium]|nr:NnrU family protein [Candidatus Competibacterales bacterium]